jgi:hypothetical protein
MMFRKGVALAAALTLAVAAPALAHGSGHGAHRGPVGHEPGYGHEPHSGRAHLDHVFVIMLENHSKSSVIDDANAPFITQLAHRNAMAANYFGVTHPSEPNYVAAIGGSNFGVNDDNPANRYDAPNLVDQLERRHISWGAYMESMPSAGFLGDQYPATAALYASKHNPFVLFTDIRNNPERLSHDKPYDALAGDLDSPHAPSFVWITPNQCHDMHGGVYSQIAPDGRDGTPCPYGSTKDDANDASLKRKADDFVKGAVETIERSRAWRGGNSAIFILTDENDFTGNAATDGWESTDGCCDSPMLPAGYQFLNSSGQPDGNVWGGGLYGGGLIPAIVVRTHGRPGYVSYTPYNHYSLLTTIEDNWHLGHIGHAGDTAGGVVPMLDVLRH